MAIFIVCILIGFGLLVLAGSAIVILSLRQDVKRLQREFDSELNENKKQFRSRHDD